jgi:hypothetical protein
MAEQEPKGNPPRVSIGEGGLVDAVGGIVGMLWKRGRGEAEKAARRGRERLALRQMRTDRDRMYQKLGKEARHLLDGGELDHPGLRRGVERVRELEARIQDAEDAMRAVGLDPEEPEAAAPASSESTG